MRRAAIGTILASLLLTATAPLAEEIPRSARLVKDAGNQFLLAKKYADAIDCYLQALDTFPDFPEAHYNLGISFLKGYNSDRLALHHFRRYLELAPDAPDRESVEHVVQALTGRVTPLAEEPGRVLGLIAGRLVVSGGGWADRGDRIEVAEEGKAPRACLIAEFVYPDCVLTQRVWDASTLGSLRSGLFAVHTTADNL